jgi:serine/threonine protein kinase
MASNGNTFIGKILGNCTLEKLIGQGGMGAVYLAQQARPSRHVAIKVLYPRGVIDNQTYNDFLTRFRREADLIARLEHINIVPIYEYAEQDGFAYLVMPYLTGGSLRDILAQRGALSLQESATYIDQAAAALDYAHAHGVIHRDLKPANFLLHSDGRLVLADFGIARMIQDSNSAISMTPTLTTAGMFLGTPEYMPPEMIRSEQIDYRADIYELGIVLFQMLTGYLPFKGDTPLAVAVQHIQEPLPALHQINPTIPSAVDAVVQKATAKKREDRYLSAAEMAHAFRAAISGTPTNTSHKPMELSEAYIDYSATIDARYMPEPSFSQSAVPSAVPQYEVLPPPPQSVQHAGNATPAPLASNWQNVTPSTPRPVASPFSEQPMTPHGTGIAYPARKRNLRPWLLFLSIALVLALVLGGIFIVRQIAGANTNNQPSGTATTQPTAPTVNPTTGTSPAVIPTSPPTPTPSPTPVLVSPQQAQALVQQYYNYINQKDYQDAYNLLGAKLQSNQTYSQFSSGFANTIHDDIAFGTITPNSNGTVQVTLTLTATETSGTSTYQGYYVVGVENGNLRFVNAQLNEAGS